MSLIEQIPLVGSFASYLIPFLIVLTIVVFVHEYGHYIVARWCGVHSEAFSIGFGPRLFGWTDRRGTEWKVSAIPLGGYVKFAGDADVSSSSVDEEALRDMNADQRARSFPGASLGRRAAIVAAGPVFNFVLAALLFAVMAMAVGVGSNRPEIGYIEPGGPSMQAGFRPGDKLLAVDGEPLETYNEFHAAVLDSGGRELQVEIERDGERLILPFTFAQRIEIDSVRTGGPADDAGIEVGDVIDTVDGAPIRFFKDLQESIGASEGRAVTLGLEREGEPFTVVLEPELREIRNAQGEIESRYLIGITHLTFADLGPPLERRGALESLGIGVERTWAVISGTLFYLYEMIAGRGSTDDLGGPIRIAEMSGDAAQQGWQSLLHLTAILSASIGLINLFPIPILDGGHLLFYAIEAVRGKPLSARAQEIGLTVGFALVVMLMLFATYNDVARL